MTKRLMSGDMDKIRLLLRSVYLKGHQDGNLKTSDMSWEDKIIKDLDALYKAKYLGMLPEEKDITYGHSTDIAFGNGFNSAIQEIKRRMNE